MAPSEHARSLGRFRLFDQETGQIYIEVGSGGILTFYFDDEVPTAEPGGVVLFDPETGEMEPAPNELWLDQGWVGVIRHISEGTAVVDRDLSLTNVKVAGDQQYEAGSTVEVDPHRGIKRVIANTPISSRDPLSDLPDASSFKRTKTPDRKMTLDDFGGFDEVKARVREVIETPFKHRDALNRIGAKPIKGVLFTGSPGNGKTMLARIIADIAEAEFYEISGPEIFNKYYGQSELMIRNIFSAARNEESAIIFFDELDSVAGRRGEESHEVSRRVVAQLLTEMDGFRSDTNVIVIATTNRPQDLDPALRRPGRFDWEVEFPLPDETDRHRILVTATGRLCVADNLEYLEIARLTTGWSAAELTSIYSEAALLAVIDGRESVQNEDLWEGYRRASKHRSRVSIESQPRGAE